MNDLVTFTAHATYYVDSESTQMRVHVGRYDPDDVAGEQTTFHSRQMELLRGTGTPGLVLTTLCRDGLIAWQKVIYRSLEW